MKQRSEDIKDLTSIQEALTTLGKELGVEIRAQHADIFLSMHRVGIGRHYVIYRQYFRNESDDS